MNYKKFPKMEIVRAYTDKQKGRLKDKKRMRKRFASLYLTTDINPITKRISTWRRAYCCRRRG